MGYSKIIFTQNNDYVAVRAGSRFAIHFTNNSNFGGAKVKVYKAMTKQNGEIGHEDRTNKGNGNNQQLVYTEPTDAGFNPVMDSVWFIFEVSDATLTTNIVVTIDHDYPNITINDVAARNIKTNKLIEQI